MKDKLETRVGYFFVFAALAAILVLELSDNLNFLRKTYTLFADFHNVNELKPGDPVKMSGVTIGKVDALGFNETGGKPVRVTLRLGQSHQGKIRTDSTATISFTGLLGQNFVDIMVGKSPAVMAAGGVLETTEQANLNAVINTLGRMSEGIKAVTDSFEGVRIDSIVGPMGHFLQHNTNRLYNIVANLESVSSQMAQSNGTVSRMLNDDGLYRSLSGAAKNIEAFSAKLTKGEGTVGKLVSSDELYKSLTAASADLGQVASDLKVASAKVAKGEGTVGKLIADDKLYQTLSTASADLGKVASDLKVASAKVAKGEGTVGRLLHEEEIYNSLKAGTQSLEKTGAKLETFANNATELVADARRTVDTAAKAVGMAQRVLEKIDAGEGTAGRLVNDKALYQETADAMRHLREILQKINRGEGTVGKLVNDDSLFKSARATLQKVDNATSSIEDQGPISVLGILFNGLF